MAGPPISDDHPRRLLHRLRRARRVPVRMEEPLVRTDQGGGDERRTAPAFHRLAEPPCGVVAARHLPAHHRAHGVELLRAFRFAQRGRGLPAHQQQVRHLEVRGSGAGIPGQRTAQAALRRVPVPVVAQRDGAQHEVTRGMIAERHRAGGRLARLWHPLPRGDASLLHRAHPGLGQRGGHGGIARLEPRRLLEGQQALRPAVRAERLVETARVGGARGAFAAAPARSDPTRRPARWPAAPPSRPRRRGRHGAGPGRGAGLPARGCGSRPR